MKKTSLRIVALFMCSVMLLLSVLGCATRNAGAEVTPAPAAESTPAQQASATAAPAAKEPTVIDYTAMWSEGEPHSEWLKSVAADYEAASGNKVNITFVGRDVLSKIKSRILTGDSPDIVDQDGSEITAALLSGDELLAEPVNDLLDAAGSDGEAKLRDAFSKEIIDLYSIDGKDYFVPYVYITSGFFYDKTLFEKLGVTAPKTWDEFIAAGEKFAAAGKPFLAQDGGINFYNAYYYYWACQRVLGAGKLYAAATDKTGAAWDDPGYLKAAEMVYELSKGSKNFFQKGYEGSAYPAAQSDWALGNQGTVLCGTWLPNEVQNMVGPDWKWGFFPFPTVTGGVGTVDQMEAYLIGWSIPKGAKHVDAAKDFLKFAINKANADKMVTATLNMSARLDTTYPEVLSEVQPYLEGAKSYFLSYDGAMSKAPQWWSDVFYDLDNQLIFGTLKPADFIAQIKAKSIEFYKNKK